MCHLKKWPVKGLCGRCLSVEAQNPIPPPFHSIQYTYSHRGGGGGWRIEPERRLLGQQLTKLGRKYQHD
jgi:hypothetical protein